METDGPEQGAAAPEPGRADRLSPGLRRVLAPNPSPMTLHGTNSYIIGEGRVAVIDPGPESPAHLDALRAALAPGETVSHVIVTHSHRDHAPLARPLARAFGAPVLAFGASDEGRSPVMATLALSAGLGGGEGVAEGFRPDERLPDGAELSGDGWTLRALHTPGHMGNHLCLQWGKAIFSGDHVMGWASSLVSPPDGDMGRYMESLDRLDAAGAHILYPGHGPAVADPARRIAALRDHRRMREAQILATLAGEGPATSGAIAHAIYHEIPPGMMAAAERNVLAHLIDLCERGRVLHDSPHGPTARYRPG